MLTKAYILRNIRYLERPARDKFGATYPEIFGEFHLSSKGTIKCVSMFCIRSVQFIFL